MTDEEKATEYTEKHIDIAISMYNPNATSLVWQAHLDGLAEGRPKWHDLRKNPNDLPKESGYYLVSRYSNYLRRKRHSQTLYFIKGKRNGWDTKMDKTQIIAWCELPKFEG